jgi:hypothetical protein
VAELSKSESDKVLAELKETGTVPGGYAVDWFRNPPVMKLENSGVTPDAEPASDGKESTATAMDDSGRPVDQADPPAQKASTSNG